MNKTILMCAILPITANDNQYDFDNPMASDLRCHFVKLFCAGKSIPKIQEMIGNANSQQRITIEQIQIHKWCKMVPNISSNNFTEAMKPHVEKNGGKSNKWKDEHCSIFPGVPTTTWMLKTKLVCKLYI